MADVITRLRVDSAEYDSKIKRASQSLLQMEQACRSVGGTLAILDKEEKAFVQSLGNMETVSKSARGSLNELTTAFTDLSLQYKRLTEEEKNGDFGKALKASLDQLKTRINDTKSQLKEIDTELNGASQGTGDFSGVLSMLGTKFGINAELMNLVTAGTMGMTAAIGAGATAVAAATKAWADYNAELAKQQQITSVTTGLKGDDADKMTAAARALASTYDVNFRDAINAANVLMTQFGKNGDEAVQLLREGMQGMINGDGPKMLNMIQQFAPAFRDAGISADQLVAVIHNSEGGLFSEQNMSAILMGIKNIRNMTSQTSKDLAQMGIDGEEMSKKMSDGTMTVFEALQQVAEALEGANSGSKEAGRVMQDVFGRQGAMQGMKLGRAIAELNTNLEETKIQTGDVGRAYDKLYEANNRLEQALQRTFGVNWWERVTKGIETELIDTLTFTVDAVDKVKGAVDGVYAALDKLGENNAFAKVAVTALELLGPLGKIHLLLKQIGVTEDDNAGKTEGLFERYNKAINNMLSLRNGAYKETYDDRGNLVKATKNGQDITDEVKKALAAANSGNTGGNTGGSKSTAPKMTEEQRAANIVESAQQSYAETMMEATLRLSANLDDTEAYKRKELQAQEQLLSAYGKAYATYADPKYKQAYDAAAWAYQYLAMEVKAEGEAASRRKEDAKALEAAQKKLATAQSKLDIANASGNLKEISSAQKAVTTAQAEVDRLQPQKVTYTIEVNDDQLKQLQALQTDDTIRVNVESGNVELPDIPKTVDQTINTKVGEVLTPEIASEVVQTISTQLGSIVTPYIATELMQVINTKVGEVLTPEIASEVVQTISTKVGNVELPEIPQIYTVTIEANTAKAVKEVDDAVAEMNANRVVIPVKVEQPKSVNIKLTTENMSAYANEMKQNLSQIDIGTGAYAKTNAQMADVNTFKTMMQVALQEGLNDIVLDLGPMWAEILSTEDIPDEVWQNLGAKLQEELKATGSKKRYGINRATGEVTEVKGESKNQQEQFAKGMQTMTGAVSSIAGGIQQMGVEIPEGLNRAITMMQGISTILTAILTITTLIKGEETVQTVTSLLPFPFKNGGLVPHAATGMLIPGNDYADRTIVAASSGELILNRAQQHNIAGQLEGASQRNNGGGTPYVLGEQIWLGVNNYLRRNGRGEIVTANRR